MRFLTEKPFADLPPREDGYPIAFWRDLAVAHGDPVARVERAVGEIAQISDSTPAARRAEIVSNAQDTIREAIASRDPEAMFRVGMMLADASVGADTRARPRVGGTGMRNGLRLLREQSRECLLTLCAQRSLGPEGFARAYATAQELKDLLARDDRQAVANYLRLARR